MSLKKTIPLPNAAALRKTIRAAIQEDLGPGDLTSWASLPKPVPARAFIRAREPGIMAGGIVAKIVFHEIDPKLRVKVHCKEGAPFRRGATLLSLQGPAQSILAGERVALNFLQMLCAIASYTNRVVKEVRGTRAKVLATRKTTPGLRALQKYAVQLGGGLPHRQGLYDEVLIKENHLDMSRETPEQLARTVRKRVGSKVPITAEARDLSEALSFVRGKVDRVLLDNMTPSQLRKTIPRLRTEAKRLRHRIEFEASGSIRFENARAFAMAGMDRISLGSLTHSVQALDLGLDIVPQNRRYS